MWKRLGLICVGKKTTSGVLKCRNLARRTDLVKDMGKHVAPPRGESWELPKGCQRKVTTLGRLNFFFGGFFYINAFMCEHTLRGAHLN